VVQNAEDKPVIKGNTATTVRKMFKLEENDLLRIQPDDLYSVPSF
jgi:hypothetical protein